MKIKKEYEILLVWLAIFLILSILIIGCGPEWILHNRMINYRTYNDDCSINSGAMGDSFGGTIGPLIALLAAFLTFIAFAVQYQANRQQGQQFNIDRFESTFYNLIDIHRQNIIEIKIGKTLAGRKTFISMYNELKFLYLFTEKFSCTISQKALLLKTTGKDTLDKEAIFNIAYLLFFFGVGQHSTKVSIDFFEKKYRPFIGNLEAELLTQQTRWRQKNEIVGLPETNFNGFYVFQLKISYLPFNGHMSRISHYIRHLFQMVKYIDDQPENIMPYEKKYNYVATVRAQLSTHEQLLLFYNALSTLGKPWFDNGYLEKYCVVKSIPLPLADFYKNPLDVLPKENAHGKIMFEWIDIAKRIQKIKY